MTNKRSKFDSNPLKWKLRTFIYGCLFVIAFYTLVIYKQTYQVAVQRTIKNSTPQQVWEFVTNFSNMLKLNPTIEEFDIINESGNLDHWKYSVHYKEHLSYLPFIKNYATAQYSVKRDDKYYLIKSNHVVCFLKNCFCVNSDSEFKFSKHDTGTTCVEQVEYECPILFSLLCYKEVMYQRNEIMKRLAQNFAT